MGKDCYVNNHEKVLQDALEELGCHDKVYYLGSWYNNFVTNRKSWGEREGMYMILQYKTKKGNTHFVRPHYDPYKPDVGFTNIMSLRYYNIGV